jgi:hypothetical protein
LVFFSLIPTQILAETSTSVTNYGETVYSPEKPLNEFQIMATANGYLDCVGYTGSAYCDWKIIVSGDLINYSYVRVIIEKKTGLFEWTKVKGLGYSYPVTPPLSTIRNQESTTLSPGTYRARLGGGFTTVALDPWGAIAYIKDNFTVK